MSILLVGCTGFLGKALIYRLIKKTKYKLLVAIRPKNGISPSSRLKSILDELGILSRERITYIHVSYDNPHQINMRRRDGEKIRREVIMLINALADISIHASLKMSIQNNTLAALNWLSIFQQCTNPQKYIYISSAFVNFHRQGIILEKIYDSINAERCLRRILDGEDIDIAPYHNPYIYSKQLTEKLLIRRAKCISLAILRPSFLSPAIQRPYCGWGDFGQLQFVFLAIALGILPSWNIPRKDILSNTIHLVPVDIAAKDCVSLMNNKTALCIRHCCFTGNNIHAITYFTFYSYTLEAYRFFKKHPLYLDMRKILPYYPKHTHNAILSYRTFLICPFLKNLYQNSRNVLHFIRLLRLSIKYTHIINAYLPYFVGKTNVFNRENKERWFYKKYPQDHSYRVFIQNINITLKKYRMLIDLLR